MSVSSTRFMAASIGLLLALALLFGAILGTGSAEAAKKKKKRDKKSPYVTAAVTVDSDGDGRVDGLLITYSEKVKVAKIKAGKGKVKKKNKNKKKQPWAAPGRTLGAIKVTGGGKQILVALSPGPTADSAEVPQLSYRRVPKGAKGVVDRAGNQALTTAVRATDGLAPQLLSARTADTNLNGRIDTLILTYSELVDAPQPASYIVGGYAVTSATASGVTVTLGLAEGTTDTSAAPSVAAIAGADKDVAGNSQASDLTKTAADGTPPAVIDAVTADTNANGRIDQIAVKFSELIQHNLE
ncbi:MAG: hypothetical protein WAP35_04845, partial [Solirubrobacterales bacterium]